MIAAARFPLRSDPAKSQFLRPRAHGRIWLSGSQTRLPARPLRRGSPFFALRASGTSFTTGGALSYT